MFGLFSKNKYQPTVTPEDKDWVEKNIIWYIEVFGLDRLKERPFIPPTTDNFPYDNLRDNGQFQKLFEQLCKYWDISPNEIIVKIFDDLKSKQWTPWVPQGNFNEPAGRYNQIYTTDEKRFSIQLARSNFENPQLLISVIAHELAHVKLLGGNYINPNDPDMEPLTDLASIFFGFGVFVANSVLTTNMYWMSRIGYLPNEIISYANALICYITKHDATKYYGVLNVNTRELFIKDFDFLTNTGDTILTRERVLDSETTYKINQRISDGFQKRNFDDVFNACNKLLEKNAKDNVALNSLGYALLLQRKYIQAIDQFTKAVEINPYWDYPLNNRGYCKLQLGDLENAFLDLQSSFEMNRENSFSWRNLGAYYLRTDEFEKALHHFEEAEKIDPKTELINFYLGHTHLKMGNTDKSKQYLNKSIELNELNDSTIE